MQTQNFYTVLKCNTSATHEELKESYQKLIKQHHPDKIHSKTSQPETTSDTFIEVDKAWKILKDESTRKQYDATLLQNSFNERTLIHAEISKNELSFQGGEAKYCCRCGNDIIILQEYLDDDECEIECSECSNCIVIK